MELLGKCRGERFRRVKLLKQRKKEDERKKEWKKE